MSQNRDKKNTALRLRDTKVQWSRRIYCGLVVLGVFAALAVLSVIAIIIVTTVNTSKLNNTQRFCIVATGYPPFGGNSSSDGVADGFVTFYVDEDKIDFDFHYFGIAMLNSIHIKGPVPEGQEYAPSALAAPLCGPPSTVACNTLTPNKVEGSINSLQPSETALGPVIRSVLNNVAWHYIQFNTANFDGVGNNGELIGRLTNECGKAV